MSPQEPTSDPQREYKVKLRQWLKENKLNIEWLAVNLKKSPGTVKNWLYNTMFITEENQDRIELLRSRIESHDIEGIIFDLSSHQKERIGHICFSSRRNIHNEAEFLEIFKNELKKSKEESESEFLSLTYNWKLAAEEVGQEFAEWITDNVMDAVRETLRKEKEKVEQNGNQFSLANYKAACGGDVLVGFKGSYTIPVIMSDWKPIFLKTASSIEGYTNCDDYIKCHLDIAAQRSLDKSLNDFLKN